jgi:hypothetical protein
MQGEAINIPPTIARQQRMIRAKRVDGVDVNIIALIKESLKLLRQNTGLLKRPASSLSFSRVRGRDHQTRLQQRPAAVLA